MPPGDSVRLKHVQDPESGPALFRRKARITELCELRSSCNSQYGNQRSSKRCMASKGQVSKFDQMRSNISNKHFEALGATSRYVASRTLSCPVEAYV